MDTWALLSALYGLWSFNKVGPELGLRLVARPLPLRPPQSKWPLGVLALDSFGP